MQCIVILLSTVQCIQLWACVFIVLVEGVEEAAGTELNTHHPNHPQNMGLEQEQGAVFFHLYLLKLNNYLILHFSMTFLLEFLITFCIPLT